MFISKLKNHNCHIFLNIFINIFIIISNLLALKMLDNGSKFKFHPVLNCPYERSVWCATQIKLNISYWPFDVNWMSNNYVFHIVRMAIAFSN